MYEKYAKRRDELGYTDYKVSQLSSASTATLSEWKKNYESGGAEGYQPKLDKLTSIASALQMDVKELL